MDLLLSSNSSSTAIRDELELVPLNLQQSSVPIDPCFDQSQALLSLTLGNQGLYSSPYFIREDGSTSHISFDDSHGRNCSGQYMFESSDIVNVGLNCRYLKPAQELLDETVSVWKTLKTTKLPLNSEVSGVLPLELPTNQDLNEKMSKLLNVLDELDGRYRQYRNQMEMLVTSFETLAGYSSSKLYTTLALQTISRQFRCIRDAINSQIRVIQRSLGEDLEATTPSSSQGRLTRLRNLDLQFRQHKSLQQFGIMQQQQQSWRPQRGLPENSVSILRAWLFEHFLNPYPKDSEKIMLARQAGLTRGQVANWFINARVRLWKPMVEEIYKEEFGEDTKASSIPDDEWKQQNHHNQKTTETNGQNLVHEEGNPLIANESGGDTLYDEIGELSDLMVENQVSLALGLPYSERITSLPATDRMPFDPNYIWEMNGR